MIFLVEYNRPEGKLISLSAYQNSEQNKAQEAKLELELDRNRKGIEHELVLLEAESETALRQGYRRYFEDMKTLLRSTARSIGAAGQN